MVNIIILVSFQDQSMVQWSICTGQLQRSEMKFLVDQFRDYIREGTGTDMRRHYETVQKENNTK